MNERGWRVGRDELAEGDENLDGSGRGRPHRALIEIGLALVEKGRGAVVPSFGLGDVGLKKPARAKCASPRASFRSVLWVASDLSAW